MTRNIRVYVIIFFAAATGVVVAGILGVVAYAVLVICTIAVVRILQKLFKAELFRLKNLAVVIFAYILVTIIFGCLYFLLPTGSISPAFKMSLLGVLDAVYFSFVTTTTLGYGDFQPVSTLARSVVVVQLVLSIFVIAVGLNYIIGSISDRSVGSR